MWKWFGRRAQEERDLDDEIQFHLTEETRQRVEAGESPTTASSSARRVFGNVTLVREVTRDMWGRRALDTLAQDLRLGVRLLARNRLFAVFSILSLALGIGGVSAVFSLFDAIALRTLPVHAPDRLVAVSLQRPGVSPSAFMPLPQFDTIRQVSQSLDGFFARRWIPTVNVSVGGVAQIASAWAVTGDYHRTLGVRPALGRLLAPDDDRPGRAAVAVISHGYWQRRFGAAPSILGQAILLNKVPFEIVGVEPTHFFGVVVGLAPEVTLPLQAVPLLSGSAPSSERPFVPSVEAMGRLRTGQEARQTYQRVLEELRTMPAAHAVTMSIVRPVSDLYTLVDRVTQLGGGPLPDDQSIRTVVDLTAPDYFSTMGIPLLAGRDFDARDTPEAPKVAIVTEQLARHFDGDPVGQRLTLGEDNVREVVGVAADTRYATVKDAPREVLYLPLFQETPGFAPTYEIKYVGMPTDVLRAAREAVSRVDPALPLFRARTLEVQTQESFAGERMLAWLTTYFGVFAWLLAGTGLYGLLAYTVAQRTREFGLRMALGAQPAAIRWAVMREGAGTVVAGVAIGLAGAFIVVRLVRTQLYGVEPGDPMPLVGAVLALLVLAISASFLPARRASRIDPMQALRQSEFGHKRGDRSDAAARRFLQRMQKSHGRAGWVLGTIFDITSSMRREGVVSLHTS